MEKNSFGLLSLLVHDIINFLKACCRGETGGDAEMAKESHPEDRVYHLIEAYARGLCDTDSFTGEFIALCQGPALNGCSSEELDLMESLCAGAQRFSEEKYGGGRELLNEAQFRDFFDRLYTQLSGWVPYSVRKCF